MFARLIIRSLLFVFVSILETTSFVLSEELSLSPDSNDTLARINLSICNTIRIPGWESPEKVEIFDLSNERLENENNKDVNSIGGHSLSILKEYGCKQIIVKKFSRGERICTLYFYNFSLVDGAYGAYSTMREGSSNVVVRGLASSESSSSIYFCKGKYLVQLSSYSEDDDETKAAMSNIADRLIPLLDDGPGLPALLAKLPGFERVNGSEKFFMGEKSVEHTLSIPFVETLNLKSAICAVSADYQFAQPVSERHKLFEVHYPDKSMANQAFGSCVSELSKYHKILYKADNQFLCKMSDSLCLCLVRENDLFLITGAKKKFAVNLLARKLGF